MPQFMPAGFYIEKGDPRKRKMRLVSFYGDRASFQLSKGSLAVIMLNIDRVELVDPPADYMEWNKVYEPRTVTEIAQDAMKNFEEMAMKLAMLANAYESVWPDEEEMSAELGKFKNKNRELKKELEGIYNNVH